MTTSVKLQATGTPTSLIPITAQSFAKAELPAAQLAWAKLQGFSGKPHTHCVVPNAAGGAEYVLVGIEPVVAGLSDAFALGHLPLALPAGEYKVVDGSLISASDAAFSWAMASYQFTRYKAAKRAPATLIVPDEADVHAALKRAQAVALTRDLVNTPAEHMGPEQLSGTVAALAKAHGAQYREWVGDDLLKQNFPALHAVGRASHRPPRLAELVWGDPSHKRVAIVGKGVCFDTGGLDIKGADGMRMMKKDMGGAANAIGLAKLIMDAQLPIHLQLLVPTVENAIGPMSYRPGDVIDTRKGVRVEIHNTDAEGRVVLCDALTYALESKPDLLIDLATLTGAARVALGPELPALFCNRDALAAAILLRGETAQDPVWRMPLHRPYRRYFDSDIADFTNAGKGGFAGAITAALYLDYFVPEDTPWIHMDLYAWNETSRPGRPAGGEALTIRALLEVLKDRYNPVSI
jgi:leucyl aminopeptidase